MNVLVTGANGFVGKAAVSRLARGNDVRVRAAVRRRGSAPGAGATEEVVVGDIHGRTDWRQALTGVDVVVHLAARVHVMRGAGSAPLEEFRPVNTEGAINLARQAAAAGVRRLVFVSSLKVNGDEGLFTETDAPNPNGGYAVSKYEAEIGIWRVADETGLEFTIVRPPLVYGPGVRANFRLLMNAVESGVPLPLASVSNLRSLVAVGNLADFLVTCTRHPAARGEVFFVGDDEDVSTAELVRRLARAMGRPARLWPAPPALLMGAASLFGKRDVANRMLKSLRVDISKARRVVGWAPPLGLDQGLALTVSGEERS